MLTKETIIDYLTQHKSDFNQKYSISKIGLFGSFARNSYHDESDIDIVYETDSKGLTFSQILQLENELSTTPGKEIDLVNLKYMNPLIKRKAFKEIVYI